MRLQLPPPRGFALLHCQYSASFISFLKTYPGCTWSPSRKAWLVPQELHEVIRDECHRRGLGPRLTFGTTCGTDTGTGLISAANVDGRLYPPQVAVLQKCLRQRSLLISAEPGCGKTAIALSVGRALGAKRTLIVCPAGVREQWKREKENWWLSEGQGILLVSAAKDWDMALDGLTAHASCGAGFMALTSYDLLSEMPALPPWDLVIFDEAQNLKNYRTKRASAAKSILRVQEMVRCCILALTGAPIETSPADLFNVLDLLRPGGFGGFFSFRDRYLETIENSMGFLEVVGAKEDTLAEFRARLDFVSARFTLSDLAPWLPAIRVEPRYVSPMVVDGSGRLDTVLQWLQELKDAQFEGPRCVVVFHRQLASEIAAAVASNSRLATGVVYVDGELSYRERDDRIARAIAENQVLVATMKSIGVGRDDLVAFKEVCIAEIYPTPGVMAQLFGRWNRLSSKGSPTRITVALMGGTQDERHVATLLGRTSDSGSLLEPGAGELAISALEKRYSDEELAAMFLE